MKEEGGASLLRSSMRLHAGLLVVVVARFLGVVWNGSFGAPLAVGIDGAAAGGAGQAVAGWIGLVPGAGAG